MRKHYTLGMTMVLAFLLVSPLVHAQADSDKIIIFVGQYESNEIRGEDQIALDSIAQWVNVEFMDSGEFNDARSSELYGEGGKNAVGVIVSESIGSGAVGNFALVDGYPVPVILMEAGMFTDDPASDNKWPLLIEGGGIWGYGSPEAVDVQWQIAEDMHFITDGYNIGDIINYSPSPGRGVPYIHGISPYHVILATASRTEGGSDNETFVQDQAVALAYIEDPAILFMNFAYEYFSDATTEFWDLLHKSVIFMFDAFPVGFDQILTEEFNLSVFPNPVTSNAAVSFSSEAGQNVSLSLYSLTGALIGNVYEGISSAGENVINLPTEGYVSGLYLVKLQIDNKTAFSKFIVK